jgi:signal peptidase I
MIDFDLNWVFIPVLLLFLAAWLLDKFWLKQYATRKENSFFLIAWSYELLPLLAILIALRSFVIEPFNIPSGSMEPNFYQGDFILVNKYTYGIRLPLLYKKIIPVSSPNRGDVVVFRYPVTPRQTYIKRMIGLPGDTIAFNEGILSVNGVALNKTPMADKGNSSYELFYHETIMLRNNQPKTMAIRELRDQWSAGMAPFVNQVDNGKYAAFAGHQWQVTVPANHYFVMGDNRDNSQDGRFWGFVPEQNLSGKAVFIWMHKQPGLHLPSFHRNGRVN